MTKSVLKSGAIVLVLSTMSAFASTHYVSQTLKPTAKLAYYPVRKSLYPGQHPVRTAKAVTKGFTRVVTTIF